MKSAAYKDALKAVDKAMGTVLDLYRELGLVSGRPSSPLRWRLRGDAILLGWGDEQAAAVPVMPWIAIVRLCGRPAGVDHRYRCEIMRSDLPLILNGKPPVKDRRHSRLLVSPSCNRGDRCMQRRQISWGGRRSRWS